jgi:YesN/AraC family two-component response regulator
MAAGFDHYLVKPVNTTQLSDILAAAAEAKRAPLKDIKM